MDLIYIILPIILALCHSLRKPEKSTNRHTSSYQGTLLEAETRVFETARRVSHPQQTKTTSPILRGTLAAAGAPMTSLSRYVIKN
jgi:hypothetical protein